MQWIKPRFRDEFGEFQRISKHFGIPLWKLLYWFFMGRMVRLSDNVWSAMENTDSWDTTTLESVRYHADHIGRDVERILSALSNPHGQLPVPVVLCLPDGRYHLVAGNTRLMVSRALGIKPTVLVIGHHTPVE
ncbi:MAG: hypothetical protein COV34_03470 [Candidatus Zambryskibacteria bacterium CG10_big_fil_rev_8_21_14_0_10_42_12]|uniref:ParB/Sulfiredoxin domain-containing protein n=1 Tax=Candidatus Zambryskibacteria bacterium CG10_big_fil_rev_8_21_14_0_10_42_12 TaxID=1975115 RepID=A0A2H0QTX7_9BACT|nr:MAG: hypothetical protein COV34_03470 [Candidatus Zambryskibacteria bacterium CG10_big_fil_rev_8_21_14_0_10_42_12]